MDITKRVKILRRIIQILPQWLMLLMINAISLACQIEKKPDLQIDLHGHQFNLYIGNDTLGELRDANNRLLEKGKCSIVNAKSKIFIEVFSKEVICYDKEKKVVLSAFSLQERFSTIAELKPLNKDFVMLISPEKMYIYDDKLKIRMSPLDSIFNRNRKLKFTSIQKWTYSILGEDRIKIFIPQINRSTFIETISLKSLK